MEIVEKRLKTGIQRILGPIDYEIFALRCGLRARRDQRAFNELVSWYFSETKAGRKEWSIGERIGLMYLNAEDRAEVKRAQILGAEYNQRRLSEPLNIEETVAKLEDLARVLETGSRLKDK